MKKYKFKDLLDRAKADLINTNYILGRVPSKSGVHLFSSVG